MRGAPAALLALVVLPALTGSGEPPRPESPPRGTGVPIGERADGPGGRSEPRILRLDPRLDALVPADASLERVADGFRWVEGPVWDPRAAALLFSDIPDNVVYRWRPGGTAEPFLRPSGYTGEAPFAGREPGSNGLLLDGAGRLVLCQHGDRRIARLDPDAGLVGLAERFGGRRLNSPNDAVLAPDGSILFTDPPFGLPETFSDPARELPFAGVYRLGPDGRLALLTDAVPAPNGIALSPDGRVLYVTNAQRERPVLLAFDLDRYGRPGPARVLFDAGGRLRPDRGVPDGIEVDRRGNLFVAGPGGIHVLAPDGAELGILDPGATTSNAAWGEDGRTLYITADHAVFRIRLSTRGRVG